MKGIRNMNKTMWMLGLLVTTVGVGGAAGCGNVEPKEADHASNVKTTNDGPDKPEGPRTGKPSAPVVIDGTVQATTATFGVGFVADATDVVIDVWGVDGLTVSSTAITKGGQAVTQTRFVKGEHVDVNVTFTAPTTVQSNLAIKVRGTFGGRVQDRVQSFTVNGNLPRAEKAPGDVKVGPDGTPVRVMKAQ
jgi:hypothetical protein